jgi:hypothetical protein
VKGNIGPLNPRSFGWQRAAFTLLAVSVLLALGAPACGNSSPNTSSGVTPCSLTSDCMPGLICAIGQCRPQCHTDVDCGGNGATCVFGTDQSGTKGFFCQPAAVANKACSKPSDCSAPMACASDYRCRNLCMTDADCNPAGATSFSKVCAQDANGVDYCASPSDVTIEDGGVQVITEAPPMGAMVGTPVTEPMDASMVAIIAPEGGLPSTSGASSGASSGGSGSTSGATGAGSGATAGSASGGAGSASGATGSAGGASGSSDAGMACPVCPTGQGCNKTTGMCSACGTAQQPCCMGVQCGADLTCNATTNICECGFANEPCCGGTGGTCNNNITCQVSDAGLAASCVCGELGTACCPAAAAGGASTCVGHGSCAGKTCGCVLEYQPMNGGNEAIVRLVDGTLRKIYDSNMDTTLNDIYQPVVSSAGPLVVATTPGAIAISGSSGPVGCAIAAADGSVWCFPLRDTLADSTYVGVGGGPGSAVSQAQQVWTSVDGSTKLSGVVQIAGGGYYYPSFCAVDGTGAIWCWGYNSSGQLGTGDTSTLPYAATVKTSLTTSFAGASEVRVGYDSTCARKGADGSIWCWGSNSYGQLGVSPSTTFTNNSNYYPNKVVITGTATATKLIVGPTETYCAVMSDTSALCWGYNGYGTVTLPTGSSAPPTTILQSAGGTTLTSVMDVVDDGGNYTICARVSSGPVYCWGSYNTNQPYPVPRKDSNNVAISTILSPLYGSYNVGLSYVDRNALVAANANDSVTQPVCNNGAGQ